MAAAIDLAGAAALLVGLGAATAADLRAFRIPDAVTAPLALAGLVWAAAGSAQPFSGHLIGATAGFATLGGIGWLWHRRTGVEALGLGDAKLFGAGGAWLGWIGLAPALLIAALAGLAAAALRAGRRRARGLGAGSDPRVPFAPFLGLGIAWTWFFGSALTP